MKKIKYVLLVLAAAVAATATAQNNGGGYGFFTAGTAFMAGNKIESRLQDPALLGSGFSFSSPGLRLGGRGFGEMGRFLIGGGGYGITFTGSNSVGEASVGVGAGFFNFGYMFIKKEKTKLYAFGGLGGGGATIKVKNTGTFASLDFAANQRIPNGENRQVSSGGFGFEAGLGLAQLTFTSEDDQSKGGLMIGLEAGIYYFPSRQWKFEANETTVNGLGNLSGIYIGVTIGGGGSSK